MLKKLPIGINTLSSIRDNDMVYVDKTPLIWQMVQQTARFFLSRPRRFGKSLLVDTLLTLLGRCCDDYFRVMEETLRVKAL